MQSQQQQSSQQGRQRLQRPAGVASTVVLTLVLALAILPQPAAAVRGLSSWTGAIITHFGGAQDVSRLLPLLLAACRGGVTNSAGWRLAGSQVGQPLPNPLSTHTQP